MKALYSILMVLLCFFSKMAGYCQNSEVFKELSSSPNSDTNRVIQLLKIARYYYFSRPDSCLVFASEALNLSQALHYPAGTIEAFNVSGEAYHFMGDFTQSLEMQFKALQEARNSGNRLLESSSLGFVGIMYVELEEYREGLNYLFQGLKIPELATNITWYRFTLSNIGNTYEKMNMLDSAFYFQQLALKTGQATVIKSLLSLILMRLGIVSAHMGKREQALAYYHEGLSRAAQQGDRINLTRGQVRMAENFFEMGNKDSSYYYARAAYSSSHTVYQKRPALESSNLLIRLFKEDHLTDSVIHYQDISSALNDSLFGPQKFRQLQLLQLKEQSRQQQVLADEEYQKNRLRTIGLVIGLSSLLIIAIILYRNNLSKQKTNQVLLNQKNEIQETLIALKSTQNQLVQREKMASLGELTAGIAHEIQNPLNFVNNFSEVNAELIEDLNIEIEKGNLEEVKKIALTINQNELKIALHGKRAETIVKSMLQHSRPSQFIKENTDIRQLIEEYLRISYNSFKANHKSFSCNTETKIDPQIGTVQVVREEIGIVLLNIFNNAFYFLHERKLNTTDGLFEPSLMVRADRKQNEIVINITDNGTGIDNKLLDKIFQPFITTKPSGKGTGLGLSISYDIIKAYGGNIMATSRPGESTTFTVQLPIQ